MCNGNFYILNAIIWLQNLKDKVPKLQKKIVKILRIAKQYFILFLKVDNQQKNKCKFKLKQSKIFVLRVDGWVGGRKQLNNKSSKTKTQFHNVYNSFKFQSEFAYCALGSHI